MFGVTMARYIYNKVVIINYKIILFTETTQIIICIKCKQRTRKHWFESEYVYLIYWSYITVVYSHYCLNHNDNWTQGQEMFGITVARYIYNEVITLFTKTT